MANIWQTILPIIGGVAGTIIAPGAGTMLGIGTGTMLGAGLGGLLGAAIGDSGGNRGIASLPQFSGGQKAEPLNRGRTVLPPSYQHGVQQEHGFFQNFDEGGPVLPVPQFNSPTNPGGANTMAQFFPNYVPTGSGSRPSWEQIAAATAAVLPQLQSGRPSLQATSFDPMTYGRTNGPNTPVHIPTPPAVLPTTVPAVPPGLAGLMQPMQSQGAGQGWGGGYSGDYGGPGGIGPGVEGFDSGAFGNTSGLGDMGIGASIGGDFGGTMGWAEGGQVQGDQVSIYQEVVMALKGRHPDPESAIRRFIEAFGVAAFNRLRMETAGDIAGQVEDNPNLGSQGDGLSDSIPATVNGTQPARLSEGEYVVSAPVVAALGNGSTEAGVRQLDDMQKRAQFGFYGKQGSPPPVDPRAVMPR